MTQVVSDPPYGIGFQRGAGGKGRHRRSNLSTIAGDAAPFDPAPWLAWPCVLFGGNHFYARLPDGGTFHTWDKACGVGPADDFSDAEYVWTSWRGKSRVIRHLWKGVLQDSEKGIRKVHVSQKPVAVMRWAIGLLPAPGRILDPYMGSGSTGVACVELGLPFVGVEIDAGHFETACRRIEEAHRQPQLMATPASRRAVQPSLLGGDDE